MKAEHIVALGAIALMIVGGITVVPSYVWMV
jgi:hypothetical protein